jgi:hypothetical protein
MPTLVINQCVICDKRFEVTYKKRSQQTCGKDCSYSLRIQTRNTQHTPCEKICATCDNSFIDTSKKKLVTRCTNCIKTGSVQKRKENGSYRRTNAQNEKLSQSLKEKYANGWNPNTEEHRAKLSILMKDRWQSGEMAEMTRISCQEKYGADHWSKSCEGKSTLSKMFSGRKFSTVARQNMSNGHARSFLAGRKCYTRGKGGIRTDIGFYVRSRWEANFARICIYEKWNFEYEPCSFDLENHKFYIPDFVVEGVFYELKGYMSNSAREKLDIFTRMYPNVSLKIIGPIEYNNLKLKYQQLINWEE